MCGTDTSSHLPTSLPSIYIVVGLVRSRKSVMLLFFHAEGTSISFEYVASPKYVKYLDRCVVSSLRVFFSPFLLVSVVPGSVTSSLFGLSAVELKNHCPARSMVECWAAAYTPLPNIIIDNRIFFILVRFCFFLLYFAPISLMRRSACPHLSIR